MSRDITIVVPCYNEEKRLKTSLFEAFACSEKRFLFVDDGSSDQTVSVLKKMAGNSDFIDYHEMPKNGGKAEAVREGMLRALELNPNSVWIAFFDADMATPLWEIDNMLKYQETFYPSAQAIWGSRLYRLGGRIIRSAVRHYVSRIFATFAYTLLNVDTYDSQCGAKIFKATCVKKLFTEPFLSKWIFDLELLLRGGQELVVEYPLQRWEDVAGSKIGLSESFRVFRDLMRVKSHYDKAKPVPKELPATQPKEL